MIIVKIDIGFWYLLNLSSLIKVILDKFFFIVMFSGRFWLIENWACMLRLLKIKYLFLINIIYKLSIGKSLFDKFFLLFVWINRRFNRFDMV